MTTITDLGNIFSTSPASGTAISITVPVQDPIIVGNGLLAQAENYSSVSPWSINTLRLPVQYVPDRRTFSLVRGVGDQCTNCVGVVREAFHREINGRRADTARLPA